MTYNAWFQCINGCPGQYSLLEIIYRCPACGDLLEVRHDMDALKTRAAGTRWTMSANPGLGMSKLGSPAGIGPTTAMPCAAKSNAHERPIVATTMRSAAGSFGIRNRRPNNAASDTALTATVAPLTPPSSVMTILAVT